MGLRGFIRVPGANRKTSIVDEWLGKQRLARCGVEIPSGQLVDAASLDHFLIESMIEDVIAEIMVGISTVPQFGQMLVTR